MDFRNNAVKAAIVAIYADYEDLLNVHQKVSNKVRTNNVTIVEMVAVTEITISKKPFDLGKAYHEVMGTVVLASTMVVVEATKVGSIAMEQPKVKIAC